MAMHFLRNNGLTLNTYCKITQNQAVMVVFLRRGTIKWCCLLMNIKFNNEVYFRLFTIAEKSTIQP